MVFTTSTEGNLLLTFQSSINLDDGYRNNYLGEFTSTMELWLHDDPDTGLKSTKRNGVGAIEWNVKEADQYVTIGIWFEHGRLVEYDGVFELPPQAIKLLNKFGIKVPKTFRE